MKLIMLKGLPASGKSTWAKEHVQENPGFRRVNKDDIRSMVYEGTRNNHEHETIAIRDMLIKFWMDNGYDIIVDDTNFNSYHEKRLRQLAEAGGYEFEIKIFNTPLQECIDRDSGRYWTQVGEDVIRDMYKKYGDQIYVVK